MKISELPPGLKELAIFRFNESNTIFKFFINRNASISHFNWSLTKEGYDFWNSICRKDFTPFYNCKVVNFKLKEK